MDSAGFRSPNNQPCRILPVTQTLFVNHTCNVRAIRTFAYPYPFVKLMASDECLRFPNTMILSWRSLTAVRRLTRVSAGGTSSSKSGHMGDCPRGGLLSRAWPLRLVRNLVRYAHESSMSTYLDWVGALPLFVRPSLLTDLNLQVSAARQSALGRRRYTTILKKYQLDYFPSSEMLLRNA